MAGAVHEARDVVVATVGLGSNLGDREAALAGAVRKLSGRSGNRLVSASSLYETEPFGKGDQGWFLNRVIRMETRLPLMEFFGSLMETERQWGRERLERWGPRTLDLDLLLFGDLVCSLPDLIVPHPGIPRRRFVLEPLCEIAPEAVHPVLGRSFRELLARLDDPCRVIRVDRAGKGPGGFSE